jgi:hypothetical protein
MEKTVFWLPTIWQRHGLAEAAVWDGRKAVLKPPLSCCQRRLSNHTLPAIRYLPSSIFALPFLPQTNHAQIANKTRLNIPSIFNTASKLS